MVKKRNRIKPKEKILKYLIENKKPVSIMNISKKARMDYKNTYNIIKQLEGKKIIIKKSIGNIKPIQINLRPNPDIYSIEKKRTQVFLRKNPKLKIIKKYTEEVNYPFMIVLIFGSYVKNMKTKNSDIDLCIISDNKEKTKELTNNLDILSLKLEIHEFSTEEFVSMIEKNTNNLGNEIVKNNLIIQGIENYYSLISKWTKRK